VPRQSAHDEATRDSGSAPAGAEPARAIGSTPRSVLLVEGSPAARGFLHRVLTARGFTVLAVSEARQAKQVTTRATFSHAVVNMRLGNGDGLALVAKLRQLGPAMRIVVVTDVDSFATVILALRAGADDYFATPIDEDQLIAALLGRTPALPPVPDTPLGLSRTCWEHVMRIFEQCDRNVTHAARRLGMHRRSLQRFLSKRAPLPRAPQAPGVDRLLAGGAARPADARPRVSGHGRSGAC
jgi:two-component system response regulator RegA